MLQQILKLSNAKKKEGKSSQPTDIKRKKRKPSTDDNIYIDMEEPSSISKRIKIAQLKTRNGKGRRKKSTKTSEWPIGPILNEVTHHASPKIWDIFERFQNFTQRKVLKRHASGLLESGDEDTTQKKPQSSTQLNPEKKNIQRSSEDNHNQTNVQFPVNNESSIGGDRKRRCVEMSDYEDELSCSGRREPLPVSAFKPKCLNFDNIDDS